jgi:hypothetical protein
MGFRAQKFQVRWVHAEFVTATVVHLKPRRDGTDVELICEAVRL